jgi:hypothetical protein
MARAAARPAGAGGLDRAEQIAGGKEIRVGTAAELVHHRPPRRGIEGKMAGAQQRVFRAERTCDEHTIGGHPVGALRPPQQHACHPLAAFDRQQPRAV